MILFIYFEACFEITITDGFLLQIVINVLFILLPKKTILNLHFLVDHASSCSYDCCFQCKLKVITERVHVDKAVWSKLSERYIEDGNVNQASNRCCIAPLLLLLE